MRPILRRIIIRVGKNLRRKVDAFIVRYSLIDDTPVFDPDMFDWTVPLQQNWREIRDEFLKHSADDPTFRSISELSPDHRRLDTGGRWKSCFLWGYGVRADQNCARYPKTAALAEQVPGLLTAMFSVHQPGAHLPSHTGVTKGMLTAHLGLSIPGGSEACRINVGDQTYGWEDGKWFVFDDTERHEVWNSSDQPRVILLLHVKRPMRGFGKVFQDGLFKLLAMSPFVRDVVTAIEKLSERKPESTGYQGTMEPQS